MCPTRTPTPRSPSGGLVPSSLRIAPRRRTIPSHFSHPSVTFPAPFACRLSYFRSRSPSLAFPLLSCPSRARCVPFHAPNCESYLFGPYSFLLVARSFAGARLRDRRSLPRSLVRSQGLAEELEDCLRKCECAKRGKDPMECLREKDVPDACLDLQRGLFECRRGQLDMRRRLRGNPGH